MRNYITTILAAAVAANAVAHAQPAVSGKDLFGDPLPKGALRRFGTVHLRANGARLAVSDDNKWIVGSIGRKHVKIWHSRTGTLTRTVDFSHLHVYRFLLSPNGRVVATVGFDGKVVVWDVHTAKRLRTLYAGNKKHAEIYFSPNGDFLAMFKDGAIWAWQVASGKKIFHQQVKKVRRIQQIAFSPDGRYLCAIAWGADRGMMCWDVKTEREVWRKMKLSAHSFAIASDGRIYALSRDCPVSDITTGQPIVEPNLPKLGARDSLSVSGDGRILLAVGDSGTIVWDVFRKKQILKIGLMEDAALSADGKWLVATNGILHCWNLPNKKQRFAADWKKGHHGAVSCMQFVAGGSKLISGANDGTVRVWDVKSGKLLKWWLAHSPNQTRSRSFVIKYGVQSIHASLDGMRIASVGSDEFVHLRDGRNGKELATMRYFEDSTGFTTARPVGVRLLNNDHVVVAFRQNFLHPDKLRLRTFKIKTGKTTSRRQVTLPVAVHGGFPVQRLVTMSPTGRRIIAGKSIKSTRNGGTLAILDQPNPKQSLITIARRPAFSNDGLLITTIGPLNPKTGGVLHALRLYDTWTGQPIAVVNTKQLIWSVAAHPNSRFAVGYNGKRIMIWDVSNGKLFHAQPLPAFADASHSAALHPVSLEFSRDGKFLATGHSDGTILLWPVPELKRSKSPLQEPLLNKLWIDLAAKDSKLAWSAVWRLAERPADSVPFLANRLNPIMPESLATIKALVKKLDSASFRDRQIALKELKRLGWRAEPPLRQILSGKPTLEVKLRIDAFLNWLEQPRALTPEELRTLRAIHVLHQAHTREARAALRRLGRGHPKARATRHANFRDD